MKIVSLCFQFQINGPDVSMMCLPINDEIRYFFSFVAKSDVEASEMTVKEHIQTVIDDYIEMFSKYGSTTEQIVDALANYSGEQTYDFTANANTDYYGYALTLSLDGKINDFSYESFRTGNVAPSDNVINMTIQSIGYDQVTYNLSTSNQDPITIVFKPKSMFDGMSDLQIVEKVISDGNLTTSFGMGGDMVLQYMATGLTPGTDYYGLAFGYKGGCATTSLVKTEFSTLDTGDASTMTFEFTIENLTSREANVKVAPTPESCLYYWDIITEGTSEESIKAYLTNQANYYYENGYCSSYADAMRRICFRGPSSYYYKNLSPDTDYRVFAIAINDADGSFAKPFEYSEVVHTTKSEIGDCSISILHEKYYKVDDLIELYPWLAPDAGMAYFPVEANVEGDVKSYYYNLYTYDATNPEQYTDDAVISALITSGYMNVNKINFVIPFEQSCTLLAVAKDSNGNFSEVFREKVVLTTDGASPVSDYQASPAKRASSVSTKAKVKSIYLPLRNSINK